MKPILYPDLVNYIFDYCSEFMTENEKKAKWHHFAMVKTNNGKIEKAYTIFKEKNFFSTQQEVTDLLKNGYQSFKESVAARIYEQHEGEIKLNICPKCFKIARTPLAKQCRYCFHSWHNN